MCVRERRIYIEGNRERERERERERKCVCINVDVGRVHMYA